MQELYFYVVFVGQSALTVSLNLLNCKERHFSLMEMYKFMKVLLVAFPSVFLIVSNVEYNCACCEILL